MTGERTDTGLLARRFEKALRTYRDQAVVQRRMAQDLAEFLTPLCPSGARVLEIGCGGGLLTEALLTRLRPRELFLNDLYDPRSQLERLVHEAQGKFAGDSSVTGGRPALHFLIGDAEELAFPASLHLVVSNAVFQWFRDVRAFWKKTAALLVRGGILAFSTFGPRNCLEIRKLAGLGLDYLTPSDILDALSGDFETLHWSAAETTLHFPTPLDVLKHFKATGVNALLSHSWSRAEISRFAQGYEALRDERGFPLTYQTYQGVFRVREGM